MSVQRCAAVVIVLGRDKHQATTSIQDIAGCACTEEDYEINIAGLFLNLAFIGLSCGIAGSLLHHI